MTAARVQPEPTSNLFSPLGVYRCQCFYRTADGLIVWFTPAALVKAGAALMIHPDLDHWAAMFPDSSRDGVSWRRAGVSLIAMAQRCGEYLPPPGYGPVNGSRLPYSPSERLAAYRLRQHDRKVSTMTERARIDAERRLAHTPPHDKRQDDTG